MKFNYMEKEQIKNLLKSTYQEETVSDNLENLNISELKYQQHKSK